MNPRIIRLATGEIDGPITVGRLRSNVTTLIGARESWVWLSRDTLLKQTSHHPDLSLDFYEDLGWLLEFGEVLPDRREHCLNIVKESGESRFRSVVKLVRTNGRIMLLSVHRIRPGDYKRLVRKSRT